MTDWMDTLDDEHYELWQTTEGENFLAGEDRMRYEAGDVEYWAESPTKKREQLEGFAQHTYIHFGDHRDLQNEQALAHYILANGLADEDGTVWSDEEPSLLWITKRYGMDYDTMADRLISIQRDLRE